MLRIPYVVVAAALTLAALAAAPPAPAQQPPIVSMENTQEVKLTEKLITSFIAAQKETLPLQKQSMQAAPQAQTEKGASASMEPDPKIMAAMEAIVKKHGFSSAQDYLNTSMTLMPYMMPLMLGSDPKPLKDESALQRKQYETELADVAKDSTLDDTQKAYVTAALKKEYDRIKPIAYPENFDVVMKMKDQLATSMKAAMTETLEGLSGKTVP